MKISYEEVHAKSYEDEVGTLVLSSLHLLDEKMFALAMPVCPGECVCFPFSKEQPVLFLVISNYLISRYLLILLQTTVPAEDVTDTSL